MLKIKSLVLSLLVMLAISPVHAQDATQDATFTVSLSSSKDLGKFMVGKDGKTLYSFTPDPVNDSVCYDKCATAWPPLTVKTADAFVPGLYLPGKFNTITRADGTLQVTYNGQPLYYYAKDQAIGDTVGENVGKVWFTVVPETLAVANKTDLGDFLTSFDGMTLYAFAKDTPGVSTCTGDCAKNWPAYTIGVNDRLATGALKGKLDTIKVDADTLLVTYNGAPLYFFAKDKVPGDANGQNVGNVWAVVKP